MPSCFGRLDDSTKRADLQREVEGLLIKSGTKEFVQEVVVAGKRRSFVLLRLHPEHHHRAGIWKVVQAVRDLNYTHSNGTKLWAAPSKTSTERKRASVATVALKAILSLQPSLDKGTADQLDIECSTGTLWLMGKKVSSQGNEAVDPGWIDILVISQVLQLDTATVRCAMRDHLN